MIRRQLGAAALASAFVSKTAGAQANGAIRFIVGFAPGGTSDVTARVVGEALSVSLGQTVLVENRPGAQGGIAIDAVVRAKPDGATVLISPPEVLYMPALDTDAPLDIEKSLTPITMLSSQPIVVAVNPQTGWKSIDDMMAAGKHKADGLTYATPGPGGTNNIIAAMMFRRAGVKYLNIPTRAARRCKTC
jgi:tripartite-type tricarboxylate transporter receptor subunit TctC